MKNKGKTMATASWQSSHGTYIAGRAHLDGVDHLACEMERKWGIDRLRLLVSADLRERFDRQRLKFNTAVTGGELADVERESGRMAKAWAALDRAAEAAGALKLAPGVWECPLSDGRVLALVNSFEEVRAVTHDGRYVEAVTLTEVAKLYEGFPEIVKAKQVWPGAKIEAVQRRQIDDPLDGLSDDVSDLWVG